MKLCVDKQQEKKQMNSAVFDIETTSLEGVGGGILLCVCVRPLRTGRTRTFRIDAYNYDPDPDYGFFERQEKDLLATVLDELAKYDMLIGHNIDRFDMGFLKTRAVILGQPWLLHPFTYDTMKAFRRTGYRTIMNHFGKPSAGMAMVADFLGLEQTKTSIYPAEWWSSVWGNEKKRRETMAHIVDHCVRDVRTNAEMYERLMPVDDKALIRRFF
jgi:DNA polymerase elongation subunit (family B)